MEKVCITCVNLGENCFITQRASSQLKRERGKCPQALYTLVSFVMAKAIQAAMQGSFYTALDQRQRERADSGSKLSPSKESYLASPTDTLPATLQVLQENRPKFKGWSAITAVHQENISFSAKWFFVVYGFTSSCPCPVPEELLPAAVQWTLLWGDNLWAFFYSLWWVMCFVKG